MTPGTLEGSGGTFYDPGAATPSDQISVPVASPGQSGQTGPALPEQEFIVITYGGQVVPLLSVPVGGAAGAPVAAGQVFAVSSAGQVAAVGADRLLYVNNGPMVVSPASQFGLAANLSYGDIVWSPDGQRLALRVDAANPNEANAIDSGIWIYEPWSNRSWQVFRTTYAGQVAQLEEQRRPLTLQWAPNGTALVVKVETPLGLANVFMPANHNANVTIDSIPYADATWAPDSASLIVSGTKWGAQTVIGRVALDPTWTYTEYLNQATAGLFMQGAVQLADGRIAFFGGPTPDAFALYIMQGFPGAPPEQVSTTIPGQIVFAEWNATRTAALVTVQTPTGPQLWMVRTDGAAQAIAPVAGPGAAAHWR